MIIGSCCGLECSNCGAHKCGKVWDEKTCNQAGCKKIGNRIVLNGTMTDQCDAHLLDMIKSGIFLTQLHIK